MGEYIFVLVALISIISAVFLLFYSTAHIGVKIKEATSDIEYSRCLRTVSHLDNAIKCCVIATNQKMVDNLKRADSFYQLDKEEAFNETRENVLGIIQKSSLKCLYPYIENLDEWITDRIEYHVWMEKRTGK